MRIIKSHPLIKLINSYLIDSAQPSNLSYPWNFGSLLATCLVIQIITGITLAMHYNPSVNESFNIIEHIMRDVNNGWLARYLDSKTASAFFFLVYLHIGRGLYYGSYKAPRTLVLTIGTFIFILMMVMAFSAYVYPYGQILFWGVTVITNLMSAIPWIGQDIVEFIWGGFSVNNATLNRFFSLHFVLPFVIAALALMHLIALHDSAGSGNAVGVSGNYDRLAFSPYFIFKDLIIIFIFLLIFSILVFFMPNIIGDSENYVMANRMQTPPAIVPEWLSPFYAILKYIPNKLLGVIAMLLAILFILFMPFTNKSRYITLYKSLVNFIVEHKIAFIIFLVLPCIIIYLGITLLFRVYLPMCVIYYTNKVIYDANFYCIYFINEKRIGLYGFKLVFYIFIGLILTLPLLLLIIKHDPKLLTTIATHITDLVNSSLDNLKPERLLLMPNDDGTQDMGGRVITIKSASEYKELKSLLDSFYDKLSETNRYASSILKHIHEEPHTFPGAPELTQQDYVEFNNKISEVNNKSMLKDQLSEVNPDSAEAHRRQLANTYSNVSKERSKQVIIRDMMHKHFYKLVFRQGDTVGMWNVMTEKASVINTASSVVSPLLYITESQINDLKKDE